MREPWGCNIIRASPRCPGESQTCLEMPKLLGNGSARMIFTLPGEGLHALAHPLLLQSAWGCGSLCPGWVRGHPEPFAAPGREARAATRRSLDGEIREPGKPARGRYAAPAASQAWRNTSGRASAKPCQRRRRSSAGPQPRLCRERVAPGAAAAAVPASAPRFPPRHPGRRSLGELTLVGGCAARGENSGCFVTPVVV